MALDVDESALEPTEDIGSMEVILKLSDGMDSDEDDESEVVPGRETEGDVYAGRSVDDAAVAHTREVSAGAGALGPAASR